MNRLKNHTLLIDIGSSQDLVKQLGEHLPHIRIDGNQVSAAELVNIDSNISVLNEWNRNRDLVEIVSVDHTEDRKEEQLVRDTIPDLSEALDMQRRLHLLTSTEQPQLHSLVNDLQYKLTDVYMHSEVSKQSCITDYFNND